MEPSGVAVWQYNKARHVWWGQVYSLKEIVDLCLRKGLRYWSGLFTTWRASFALFLSSFKWRQWARGVCVCNTLRRNNKTRVAIHQKTKGGGVMTNFFITHIKEIQTLNFNLLSIPEPQCRSPLPCPTEVVFIQPILTIKSTCITNSLSSGV